MKLFTNEEKQQERAMASREMFTHSYQHRRSDPDNCAACALNAKHPNYSGWPLLFMAAGRTMKAKDFTDELIDSQRHNERYYQNLLDHMFNYGAEIRS